MPLDTRPSPAFVVCAALRYKDIVILGPRHFDLTMRDQIAHSRCASMVPPAQWEQGFVDQRGNFLTREEAWKAASSAGQIARRVGGDGEKLFSENLY